MEASDEHVVGLRELRHRTGAVIRRVRDGETVDVTDHGRVVARIVPAGVAEPSSVLARLIASGRARPAERPGYRPARRSGDGGDRLSQTLRALRDEEEW